MSTETREKLIAVKEAREIEEQAKERKKMLLEAAIIVEASEALKNAETYRKHAEQALRDHVLTTGDAILGLGFRNNVSFEYTDEDALAWSKENFSLIVSETYDKKELNDTIRKRHQKGKELPEFVTVKTTKSITIPTDLSKIEEN
jgi:hypothetical protein